MQENRLDNSKNIDKIIERISQGSFTTEDIKELSQLIQLVNSNIAQIGKYNIAIGSADRVQIGDQIYQGLSAESIQHALHEALKLKVQPKVNKIESELVIVRLRREIVELTEKLEKAKSTWQLERQITSLNSKKDELIQSDIYMLEDSWDGMKLAKSQRVKQRTRLKWILCLIVLSAIVWNLGDSILVPVVSVISVWISAFLVWHYFSIPTIWHREHQKAPYSIGVLVTVAIAWVFRDWLTIRTSLISAIILVIIIFLLWRYLTVRIIQKDHKKTRLQHIDWEIRSTQEKITKKKTEIEAIKQQITQKRNQLLVHEKIVSG